MAISPKKALAKKILVVDDNAEFCRNVSDILELKHWSVVTAHDGQEALELAKDGSFDLALMDCRMPFLNGVEAFEKMKENTPEIRVILMSAYAVEEKIHKALRDGALDFLKKPIDYDRLFALIGAAPDSDSADV